MTAMFVNCIDFRAEIYHVEAAGSSWPRRQPCLLAMHPAPYVSVAQALHVVGLQCGVSHPERQV